MTEFHFAAIQNMYEAPLHFLLDEITSFNEYQMKCNNGVLWQCLCVQIVCGGVCVCMTIMCFAQSKTFCEKTTSIICGQGKKAILQVAITTYTRLDQGNSEKPNEPKQNVNKKNENCTTFAMEPNCPKRKSE